jgi:hypothetical protein
MTVNIPFVIPLVYSLVFMVLRKVSERNASHNNKLRGLARQ